MFLLISVILFSVMGICEFIYILRMFFYYPNTRSNDYLIIVLKSGYALKQLNYVWQKLRWHGDSFATGIIAVTDDIKENELLDCNIFIKSKNIILCTKSTVFTCEQLKGS